MLRRTKRVSGKKVSRAASRRSKRVRPRSGFKFALKLGKKGKKLPRRLSGWIRIAVEDAKKLAATDEFVLKMSTYNTFVGVISTDLAGELSQREVCEVCLGGAALVGEKLVKPGAGTNGASTSDLAQALDNVRTGNLALAIGRIYKKFPSDELIALLSPIWRRIMDKFSYTEGRADWETYLKAADELEALGL
jgi:hypothetical protein